MANTRVRKAANKGDYYTDVPASNVAISRFQKDENFVAAKAAARLLVNKPSGLFDAWDMANINRDEMHDRGDNDRAKETTFVKTQTTYKVPTKSIAIKLNDIVQKASDVHVNPRLLVGRVLGLKALIRLERQLAELFVATAWFRTVTGTAGAEAINEGTAAADRKKFSDLGTDPLPGLAHEIQMQGLLTGQEPTGMIFGRKTWRSLRYHSSIRAALTSGGTPVVRNKPASMQEMASLLELEWIGVSKAIHNTKGENLPPVNDYIIPPDSALLYYRPAMGADQPGVYNNEEPAALARLTYAEGSGTPDGIRVRQLRDEFAGSGGSDHWEIDSFNQYQVLTKDMGTLFLGMV